MTPLQGSGGSGATADDGADGDPDDAVWKALANPLRRRMLDELRIRPLRTKEVAQRFEESRHVVMQHLAVLRAADLVRSVPDGRSRVNYLNPVPIQQINRRWVSRYDGLWSEALLGLKDRLEDTNTNVEPNEGEQHSG